MPEMPADNEPAKELNVLRIKNPCLIEYFWFKIF